MGFQPASGWRQVPPIFVHFGLALAACALVGRLAARRPERPHLAWLGWGLVVGAVAPDADLVLSSLATAAAGFDTSVGKDLHRTFTHSVAMVAALALGAAVLWSARPRLAHLLAGSALGVAFLHVTPDLAYLVAVKPWAPFSLAEVGPYGPIVKERFTDAQNNAINAIDFLGESLSLLATWWLLRRIDHPGAFRRWLPWLAAVNAAIFLPLLVFVAPHVSYDAFLIWSYAPGFPFLVVMTILVPWKGRDGFLALGGQATGRGAAPAAAPTQP